jgi:hypothetical protein
MLTRRVDSVSGTRSLKPVAKRKPIEIGFPLSLLLIPILIIAGGLSVPHVIVARSIRRRRERVFQGRIRAAGRVMEWSDLIRAVDETRGTIIEERYSLKGPVRWWWTAEDPHELCPHVASNWRDESFRSFSEWCQERYTSIHAGRALLIATVGVPEEEIRSLQSRLRSQLGTNRLVEVVVPEFSRGNR